MTALTEQLATSTEVHDRSKFLGSSEIAAILGISPWKTAYDVWESKQPWYVPEEVSPAQQKRFDRGKRFEPVILDQYQQETGAWITARNTRYIDEEYPFLTCEIDAEETDEQTSEITNVEIKSVSVYDSQSWGAEGTDEIPPYYTAQTLHGLMVSRRKVAKPVALIGLDDLRKYLIPRDEEVIAVIREKAVNFWLNHVLTGVPPAIQSKEDAQKMISRLSGVTVEADYETRLAIDRLSQAKAQKKAIEKECEELELTILRAIASGTDGEPGKALLVDSAGNKLASWNLQTRPGYTTQPTSYRVLRLNTRKGVAA